MTSVAGSVDYGIDEADRVSTITASLKSLTAPLTFNFTYNPNNGFLNAITCTNSGMIVSYNYDDMDNMTDLSWVNGSNQTLRSFFYGLNNAGMATSLIYQNGEQVQYDYDDLDRLIREKHTSALGELMTDQSYSLDEVGNRTSKTATNFSLSYTYGTGNNRLQSWCVNQTNLTASLYVHGTSSEAIESNSRFGYLWVSNLMTRTPTVDGTNFWVDNLSVGMGTQMVVAAIRDVAGNTTYLTNQVFISVVTNGAYLYNTAGCITNITYTGQQYSRKIDLTWNSKYQLTQLATNGAVAEKHGYDALGRRAWTFDGTTTNYYVWDGQNLVADVDSTGGLQRAYIYAGLDCPLALVSYSDSVATVYYFLTDRQGTVHGIADTNGNLVEQYRFDAFGRLEGVFDGSGKSLVQSAIGNRLLFHGREYSWGTGLYFFRARWYDPISGRWLSNDPIGISGGLNQYVFCANNPVNFVDPTGLKVYNVTFRGKTIQIDDTKITPQGVATEIAEIVQTAALLQKVADLEGTFKDYNLGAVANAAGGADKRYGSACQQYLRSSFEHKFKIGAFGAAEGMGMLIFSLGLGSDVLSQDTPSEATARQAIVAKQRLEVYSDFLKEIAKVLPPPPPK